MAIIVEPEDPGVRGVRRAVKKYIEHYPELADVLEMSGAIMEVQQRALREVTCEVRLNQDEIDERLRAGTPLFDPFDVDLDAGKFRELVGEICGIVDAKKPGGFPHLRELMAWEGLNEENLPESRARVLEGGGLSIGEDWGNEADRDIALNILWEALAPFYRKCGSIYQSKMDQSLWQKGFCPVCGGRPLMGKFRKGDGMWLLECSLCHTTWNVQRAKCPFCSEGTGGSLKYLYVRDEPRYRVQYCEGCGCYVKTVDMRDSAEDALLQLEDMVTIRLDRVAKEEGLKPPERFA